MDREPQPSESSPPSPSNGTPNVREARGRRVAWWPGLLATAVVVVVAGLLVARLDRANNDLRRSLADTEEALTVTAAKAKADATATKAETDAALEKVTAESRGHMAVRDAHLTTAQFMRVAGVYKTDPLSALALLHDYEIFPIDRRDAVWHFYAHACERRLRPDDLGRVVVTALHGRRMNVFPVPHRDADGRVLALVEAPDGTWKVIDLTSGEVVRTAHAELKSRGRVDALSLDGRTAGVWTTGKAETPSEYGFVDVESGKWHKLRLRTTDGLLTPDGKRFVVHSEEQRAVYDVATGEELGKEVYGERVERMDSTCAVSADGKHFASYVKNGKSPGVVRVIDAQTNKVVAAVAPPKREIELHGKTHPITDPEAKLGVEVLQFSPDGQKLAIVYRYSGKISIPEYYSECHVVSVPDGTRIGVHGVPNTEFATYVAFNRSGSLLAVACGLVSGWGGSRGTLGVYRTDPPEKGDLLLPVVHKFPWPVPLPHPLASAVKGADHGLIRGLSFTAEDSRVTAAVQTDGGYHAVEADIPSGRLRLFPTSLPHVFGRENTDANVHLSSRNELLVASEFGTLHRWRLNPDDATATLPHHPPHHKLRLADTELAFANDGARLFVRYHYSHWHDGRERIADPPADLVLHHEQYNAQWYQHVKSLEPPAWKPQGLTDHTAAAAVLPKSGQVPPPPPVSADGHLRAATTPNGDIELWDVGTNRLRATLEGHGHPVTAVRFSPDGKSMASLDRANAVKVWDFRPPALYGQWQGTAAAFSPDGKTLAVGGHRIERTPIVPLDTVTFFDLKTGRKTGQIKNGGDPPSMEYSPDGEVLAGGNTLYARDASGWKEIEFDGPRRTPGEVRRFLPEPKVLAEFNENGSARSPTTTPEQAQVTRGGSEPRAVTLFQGTVEKQSSYSDVHRIAVGFCRSDKTVVVVQPRESELGVAHYDPATGKRTESRTVSLKRAVDRLWPVVPGGESVVATDQTSGEILQLTATLQVIDLKTGAGQPLPGTHTGGCALVAASPDGNRLASGDALGVIRVWDLRTRKMVKQFWAHGNGIQRLVLSPDGQNLAVVGADKMVRVWDLSALGNGD